MEMQRAVIYVFWTPSVWTYQPRIHIFKKSQQNLFILKYKRKKMCIDFTSINLILKRNFRYLRDPTASVYSTIFTFFLLNLLADVTCFDNAIQNLADADIGDDCFLSHLWYAMLPLWQSCQPRQFSTSYNQYSWNWCRTHIRNGNNGCVCLHWMNPSYEDKLISCYFSASFANGFCWGYT